MKLHVRILASVLVVYSALVFLLTWVDIYRHSNDPDLPTVVALTGCGLQAFIVSMFTVLLTAGPVVALFAYYEAIWGRK